MTLTQRDLLGALPGHGLRHALPRPASASSAPGRRCKHLAMVAAGLVLEICARYVTQ